MAEKTRMRITAVMLTVCMILTALCMDTRLVFGTGASTGEGDFDPSANGFRHGQKSAPQLILTGKNAGKGDGFTGSYKYLTQEQLDGINSEETAKACFPSAEKNLYLKDIVYSAKTKAEKGGWGKQTISGLDLTAIAQAMGIDTESNVKLFFKGKDGYSGTVLDIFSKERYSYSSENAATGTAVGPAIALKSDADQEELPRLVFGQMYSGEYNMLNWGKWLKVLWLGEKTAALSINLGGQQQNLTLADVISTKSGRWTSTYQYTDGTDKVTVQAEGIPLDKLLTDNGITGAVSVKTNTGKTISGTELPKYFLAYDAEENGTQVRNNSSLILYGPGENKGQAVDTQISSFDVDIAAPSAVTGLKAVKKSYNSIKLTWKKVSGAEGYNIYRCSPGKKTYALLDCVEGASKLSYTDKGLKTGSKYTYKVKAYKTAGSVDLESAFSSAASAVPALDKPSVTLSKSGSSAVKAKWTKISGANGYQLQMGTNSKITKEKKTYTVKAETGKTITNLKKGKRYYVKVRPYRSVSGKKVYGAFSSVRSIKR